MRGRTIPSAPPQIRTERRRLLQPLWNALDAALLPSLPRGALLAVSGGPDSRALLEVVARWPRRFDGEIRVACVDHGTRREAHEEALSVVGRSFALGLAAAALPVEPRGDDEASLRDARLDALAAHARLEGLAAVVTAHHAGDVAEGALLSWLGAGHGGGGSGAAMVASGRWSDVAVIRPFLEIPRTDLRLALLACRAWDVFTDPDERSARARVRRHRLVPLGAGRVDVEERLAAAARQRRDDEDVLSAQAAALLAVDEGGAVIRVRPAPRALLRRALRQALALVSPGVDVRSASPAVEIAVRLVGRGEGGTVHMPGAIAEVSVSQVTVRPTAGAVAAVRAPTHDGPTHEGTVGRRLSASAEMRRLIQDPGLAEDTPDT